MLRAMLRNSKAVQTAVAMPPRRAKKMGQLNMRLACGYLSTLELKKTYLRRGNSSWIILDQDYQKVQITSYKLQLH